LYTTHDFYGLCPKVTFFQNQSVCLGKESCIECKDCCSMALSIPKIRIMQSKTYRVLKNTAFIKKIRKKQRNQFFENKGTDHFPVTASEDISMGVEYENLREYYLAMFKMIDMIHFNSSITKEVYMKFFVPENYRVISISNQTISENKKVKLVPEKIQMGFLSVANPAKGYFILKQALEELAQDGYHNFELNLFDGEKRVNSYIQSHNPYPHDEMQKVMDALQVVIIPSTGYETFSFTALEALSCGVPVIVSELVGAKDIIEQEKSGYIVEPTVEGLKFALRIILENPKEILGGMNQFIVQKQTIKTMDIHAQEMLDLYSEIL
ncbi:MAG: glycosyltransferase, partial [Lachnospiraceae bacterium]|nr:glycosyltransferase [Lachnospiraceae bacterium]